MAMKDAGVNIYRWQGGEQRPATIISEPDRNVRYARLAGDFAASVKAGEESVAQVSGVREQAILTQAIRSELKRQGVLGHPEVTMTALSPVWLDSRSRYLRDMYRPGMVMEQWNPETRSHDRYVIDRVPRLEGAWAPEHSVTEFSHSQEAKLAEAQQKAMLKGEAFPDVPMTLYEAIVRDYTGRTPEAREQTLIVTHLNEDRRVLNSMIHDAREKAGELGKEQVMVPVLNTANIPRHAESPVYSQSLGQWNKLPPTVSHIHPDFPEPYESPADGLRGKNEYF